MKIEGNSVSECWLKALTVLAHVPGTEISPLIIKINIGDEVPDYAADLERDLGQHLSAKSLPTIQTTANTIFPANLAGGGVSVFERFETVWKHVKKCPKNKYGHYFRRLVAYAEYTGQPVNQLKKIIDTYNGVDDRKPVHRRSALIATTFDPVKDHVPQPMRGFPCLQQVCFLPNSGNGEMTMNAIYAMQYLSDRAYGNYQGLVNLGKFMAEQMGVELTQLHCMISTLDLGNMSKTQAKLLAKKYPIDV